MNIRRAGIGSLHGMTVRALPKVSSCGMKVAATSICQGGHQGCLLTLAPGRGR
jgi:hypothetical protein